MRTLKKIRRVLEIVATVAAVAVILIDKLAEIERPAPLLKQ